MSGNKGIRQLSWLGIMGLLMALLLVACGDSTTAPTSGAGATTGTSTTASSATTAAMTTAAGGATTAAMTSASATTAAMTSASATTAAMTSASATTAAMTSAAATTSATGTTAAASFNETFPAYTGPDVTLVFQGNPASGTPEDKFVQQILGDFQKQYPNIKVTWQPISQDYDTKLKTELAGGSPPDVFYVAGLLAPDFMSAGVLAPLDDYIARDKVDTSDFYPSLLQTFQYNGKTYGLPKDTNTLGLYYNTQMFQAAGISNPPTTWDEFKADAQKLTQNGVYGTVLDPDLNRYLAFVYQNGGSFLSQDKKSVTFNSPATTDALSFIFDLYKNKYAVKASDAGAGWAGEAFGKQKAAMVIEGGWLIPPMKSDYSGVQYKIAELPKGKQQATMSFTVSYSVSAKSQHKDAAWILVNYLTSKTGMKAWTDLGIAQPSRKSLGPGFSAAFPERAPLIKGQDYGYSMSFGPGFSQVVSDGNNDLQGVYAGKEQLSQAIQSIQQKAQDALSNQ